MFEPVFPAIFIRIRPSKRTQFSICMYNARLPSKQITALYGQTMTMNLYG